MDAVATLPDKPITENRPVSKRFLNLGIHTFLEACHYVHELPYGYNANRDELMILFDEGQGTCTTKHAVIATLAQELGLPVGKTIGVYAMTEALVTGADRILAKYGLPYVPMVHCFLESGAHRVDLTEGNRNGKNGPIDEFLHTQKVEPNISGKEEYRHYRRALTGQILGRKELAGADVKTALQARAEGLDLLKEKVRKA
jgi:hypothetical protein